MKAVKTTKYDDLTGMAKAAHQMAMEAYSQGHPNSVDHDAWINQHHKAMLMRAVI